MTIRIHARKSPAHFSAILIFILVGSSLVLQGCPAVIVGAAAGGTAMVIHDRRDSESILQDQKIESTATNSIYNDEKLDKKIHANVTSYNRVALITGEVLSNELRDHAANIVRNIAGVKRVHNELVVEDLTSMASRSKDAWITSRVKSKMLNSDKIDSTRVKVVTENGVVFLMGLVTERESDAAVDVARNVEDVKRVVKIFEIVPEPADPKTPGTATTPVNNK